VIAKVKHFRNRMLVCYGVDKPMWLTELACNGHPQGSPSLLFQARYILQGHTRALAAGAVNITWYALTTPNDPYEYQLLYNDWSPKPSFYSYQTLNAELLGHTYVRMLNVPGGEAYVFVGPAGREKTAAWGTGQVAFAPASRLRVVDRMGNETFIQDGGTGDADGAQNGAVALALSDEPVFAEVVN
jgi:hypothetical protein